MIGKPALNPPRVSPDAIFDLLKQYKADKNPNKVDLGIGAYRTNDGQPWVLPVVRKVDKMLANDESVNHEYLPISGNPAFCSVAAKLVFGSSIDLSKVVTVQTLSGSGANHMGALLLARFGAWGSESRKIWVSDPTWSNHHLIFGWAGLSVEKYPYWNNEKRGLDFDAMILTLKRFAKKGDTLLLHACAHNPTGVDPTREQWKVIADVCREIGLFVLFDCAYQGFASGNLDYDAWAIRYFVEQNIEMIVCQSFSKNMGLYGERCGAVHVVVHDGSGEARANILSQLDRQTRAEFSNCPGYGARIATRILSSPELFDEWKRDVGTMANRIKSMRAALRRELENENAPGNWDHITSQIGMFSYTGLTSSQVSRMIEQHHVYLASNGRVSMAGVNENNVEYIARAIKDVVTSQRREGL